MKWLIGLALFLCWVFGWLYITSPEAAEFGLLSATTDVSFEWTANVEADLVGYNIYRSGTSGAYDKTNLVGTVMAPAVQFVDVAVEDGEWYWALTAIDTAGNESALSVEATAVLDTIPPAIPQDFHIVPAIIVPLILD